jgi:hypothetical protein
MLEGHVAPSTVVVGQIRIGRTEVGGCHSHCRARYTPSRLVALELKARSAAQAVVEESRAQSCCVGSIALTVQVPITASTSCSSSSSHQPISVMYTTHASENNSTHFASCTSCCCRSQTNSLPDQASRTNLQGSEWH